MATDNKSAKKANLSVIDGTDYIVVNGCYDTKLNERTYKFKWVIHNFSMMCNMNKNIISPKFCADNEVKCHLKINLETDRVNIGLSLYVDHCKDQDEMFLFKVKMLNSKGKTDGQFSCPVPRSYKDLCSGLGWSTFGTRKSLCEEFLVEDRLTLLLELTAMKPFNILRNDDFRMSGDNLLRDFASVLNDKKFCDVTLIVGEHKFAAHKVVLAARSQVFAAMFEHNMEESKMNVVTVEDINPNVFQEMLAYIYTGNSKNLDAMAVELFVVADKYALDDLKRTCSVALGATINAETAAEILITADLHSADKLKAMALSFISYNSSAVLKTRAWKDLVKSYPNLLADAFQKLSLSNSMK